MDVSGGGVLIQAVRMRVGVFGRNVENWREQIVVEGCNRLWGPARTFTAVERREHSIANCRTLPVPSSFRSTRPRL